MFVIGLSIEEPCIKRTASQKNIGCSQYLGLTLPLWRKDLAIQTHQLAPVGRWDNFTGAFRVAQELHP
ncbi:hypothetical protein [Glaciecola sp. MF2-115]|uniref:hypothetical protein n=1 Tax=Glaciecola sp. MF2-115 TaxID=3384827 RepID=UPI0039A2C1DF